MRQSTRPSLGWLPRAAALAMAVTLVVAWPYVQRFTTGVPPQQFQRESDPALTRNYPGTLGIAHNAGNRIDTTEAALAHGADVIEVDVISVRGVLRAGREQPWAWLGDLMFRGPTLTQLWEAAAPAEAIQLDLKQDDPRFIDQVADFLQPRAAGRRVMVASRDARSLMTLHQRVPEATMIFTLAFPEAVDRLRSHVALRSAVDGVSVFHGLVEPDLVSWLHDERLQVLAWAVNDVDRLDDLVRAGVDGVTTGNLAILEALD